MRHIGLSEVGAETLRRAAAVHPIADLQIEYSLISRGIEAEILPTARELGVGITAYGVLSRGLLSGHWSADRDVRDFRAHLPRFTGENLEANLRLVEALRDVAEARGATVAQVAIAWVASRGRRDRAAGRRPHPDPADGVARRSGPGAVTGGPGRDRGGRARGRGGRHPLRRGADVLPGQREVGCRPCPSH